MEQYDKILIVVTNFWFLLAISYIGILLNFLNNQIKGESWQDIKSYITTHLRTVISSFLTTSILYLGYYLVLSTGEAADVFSVVMIGYACDSYWDKVEMKKLSKANEDLKLG